MRKGCFWILRWTSLIVMSLVLIACGGDSEGNGNPDGDSPDGDSPDGDEPDGDDPDGDDPDGDVPGPFVLPQALLEAEIEWADCPLYEGSTSAQQRDAECADVPMPVDWYDVEGQTLLVRVKRLRQSADATRQIWLLHGGPGGPGSTGLAWLADLLNQADPKADIYLLDHRGVGFSTRIGCPQYEADDSENGFGLSNSEWTQCVDWLQSDWGYPLHAFTTTQAAIDVGYLVELAREETKDVIVYGCSYGSYWGHRYAQLFPEQSEGVVLDSVPPSIPTYLDRYDVYADATTRKLFDMCAEDDFCSEKLGSDPAATAEQALADFRDGHCSVLTDSYGITMQYIQMASFTLGRDWNSRVLVPALYYRLARCNEDDVAAIVNAIFKIFGGEVSFADRQYGYALGNHIILSEMLSEIPLTVAELEDMRNDMLTNNYLGERLMSLADFWPTYTPDDYWGLWADPSVPILSMNGTLDLQTPIEVAVAARDALTGEHQTFVEIPFANHGVLTQSPVQSENSRDCGLQIMLSFMDNPQAAPDTSCLNDLREIDFAGNPAYNNYYLGIEDAWETSVLELSCSLPDDFLTPQAANSLTFILDGVLADGQPGSGEVQVTLDGETHDYGSYAIAAVTRSAQDGTPIVTVTSYGSLNQVAPNQISMKYMETNIGIERLESLKTAGENRLDYDPETGGFFAYLSEVNDKTVGSNRYVRMCPTAILTQGDYTPSLWVCVENNSEFVQGEPFEIAANLPMTTDSALIGQVLANEGACYCYQHGGSEFDCADWDTVGQDSLSPVPFKTQAPYRAYRRPDLPTFTPEAAQRWRLDP